MKCVLYVTADVPVSMAWSLYCHQLYDGRHKSAGQLLHTVTVNHCSSLQSTFRRVDLFLSVLAKTSLLVETLAQPGISFRGVPPAEDLNCFWKTPISIAYFFGVASSFMRIPGGALLPATILLQCLAIFPVPRHYKGCRVLASLGVMLAKPRIVWHSGRAGLVGCTCLENSTKESRGLTEIKYTHSTDSEQFSYCQKTTKLFKCSRLRSWVTAVPAPVQSRYGPEVIWLSWAVGSLSVLYICPASARVWPSPFLIKARLIRNYGWSSQKGKVAERRAFSLLERVPLRADAARGAVWDSRRCRKLCKESLALDSVVSFSFFPVFTWFSLPVDHTFLSSVDSAL